MVQLRTFYSVLHRLSSCVKSAECPPQRWSEWSAETPAVVQLTEVKFSFTIISFCREHTDVTNIQYNHRLLSPPLSPTYRVNINSTTSPVLPQTSRGLDLISSLWVWVACNHSVGYVCKKSLLVMLQACPASSGSRTWKSSSFINVQSKKLWFRILKIPKALRSHWVQNKQLSEAN